MTNAEAINRFFYWSMNYDGSLDWIKEIFPEYLVDHFTSKFKMLYNRYGSMGVIPAFYGELDTENRQKLIDWVLENYTSEVRL